MLEEREVVWLSCDYWLLVVVFVKVEDGDLEV
ncbi:hypothetical protein A2U01_0118585, partial [Trifolium medium]|nr:hypothetical protein [Trifolium medium]